MGAEKIAAKKKQCGRGKKRCGKRCIPKQGCCKDAQCLPGQTCQQSGKCEARSRGQLAAGDAVWTPCGAALGGRFFEAYPYTLTKQASGIWITMRAPSFSSWIWLYRADGFNPEQPCSGFIASSQAGAPGQLATIRIPLAPGSYVVVATSAATGNEPAPATGSFTLRIPEDVEI